MKAPAPAPAQAPTAAALTTIEKQKKLNKIFTIEPCPKYIKDIIISRRQRYLKAHPKHKRKMEAKMNIQGYNEQIMKYDREIKTKDYMDLDIQSLEEINRDIHKDEKYLELEKHIEKLSEEETTLKQTIKTNKEKVETLEKTIETGKDKEQELGKKQQEIYQKIEELKSRKRKMFEMMKK